MPAEPLCQAWSAHVTTGVRWAREHTVNIEALQWAAGHAKVLETVEATLSTTDKYATLERSPQLPHPVTFSASTLSEALEAIERLPRGERSFVLKDRYGYGCGAGVHRLIIDGPTLEDDSPATWRTTATS